MNQTIRKAIITPDPKILVAIARTAITPINALCELIDNSIDGFINAERTGNQIENPYIKITVPTKQDIDQGVGVLLIEDNGPGMDPNTAVKAVTAGFSGQQNPRDNLGLFGMGFNIATAKLGRKTILISSRKEDKTECKITIDLQELIKTQSFEVPLEETEKNSFESSGTSIEVKDWWPNGDPNHNFIIKLASSNKKMVREQIGRIYATKIRKDLKIYVNDILVNPFYHCHWLENRYVVGKAGVKIPAYFSINETIGKELRCTNCYELATTTLNSCPNCGEKNSFKEYKNIIKGWLGIQRFAHPTNYGIDLIRNGRLIHQWEKEPFFEWVNPENEDERVKDYPIDPGQYSGGRIIGEIHLDFVPVDFLKTSFQTTSLSWINSISYLRGETSLQPTRAAGKNDSVIYKLFQGYRRIEAGPKWLYPGYWGTAQGQQKFKPLRAEDAEEYYEKFKNNEPGWGPNDDQKWWELVEQAQDKPEEDIIKCPKPDCGMVNDKNAEICFNCGYLFRKKQCVKCKEDIPLSETTCHLCGEYQGDKMERWTCDVCSTENSENQENCSHCEALKGTSNNLTLSYLEGISEIIKELSINESRILLPNDQFSQPLTIEIRKLKNKNEQLKRGTHRIPIYVDKTAEKIVVIIDTDHPAYTRFQDRPADYAAIEIANTILTRNEQSTISKEDFPFWSIANIYYLVQSTLWPEQIETDPEDISNEVKSFYSDLAGELVYLMKGFGREVYNNMDKNSQNTLTLEISKNTDIGQLNNLIDNNLLYNYFTHEMIVQLIKDYPSYFFDGKYWEDTYSNINTSDHEIETRIKKGILSKYINCLENLSIYLELRSPTPTDTKRAELALLMLQQRISS